MALLCCPTDKYMETEMIDCGAMRKLSGSDTAKAPFGIVIEGLPLKVTDWTVDDSILLTPAEPLNGSATETAVIGKSVTPKAFEMRIRIWSPPVDMCKVWRMVEFGKTTPV